MEEEKLLRILKIFFVALYVLSTLVTGFKVFASSTNLEVADLAISMGESAKKSIWVESQDIIRKFLSGSAANINDSITNESSIMASKPKLLIFVSTSMSETLLKNYYKEASKIEGILVFKGLPNGSFKELVRLIMRLNDGQNKEQEGVVTGAVIDDESFNKFGVSVVPTIVLIKEEECLDEESCKVEYDKIAGNIGVRAALQEFARNGDMKIVAGDMLKR